MMPKLVHSLSGSIDIVSSDSVAGHPFTDEKTDKSIIHEASLDSGDVKVEEVVTNELEEYLYPEGGFWGWSALVGAFLIQFATLGLCGSFGVFQDYYTRVYLTSESPSVISWSGSVMMFLAIATSLFTGVLYDRGYFYHMLYGGSFLTTISLFILSLAKRDQLYQIFLIQGLVGLGTGILYLPSIAIVSQYFQRKQSFAMIIVITGSALGAAVHPIILNQLLNNSNLGFGNTVRIIGGLVLGLLVIACSLIRSRGLPPTEGGASPSFMKVVVSSIRDVPYMCMIFSLFTFTAGFYYPMFYLQLMAIMHGVDATLSFYLFPILNGVAVVGNIVSLFFIESIGVSNMLIGTTAVAAVGVFAMLALKDSVSAVVITVIFGFSLGVSFNLQPPMIALLTRDKSELGARMGIGFTFLATGALIGPPIHGALLTTEYQWWRPAIFGGVSATIGAVGFALLPWLVKRKARQENARASHEESIPA